jgi:hypothetical protein
LQQLYRQGQSPFLIRKIIINEKHLSETEKVPPLIKFNSSIEEKSCIRAEMRVALFMGQSQFLISDENVSGNCSEMSIGWPSHPFPDIGEIKLMFSLDERKNELRSVYR